VPVYGDEAGWAYEHCIVAPGAIACLMALRAEGYCIVIHTARVCEENEGGRFPKDRGKTERWLAKHRIPYDRLVGKTPAVLYIDDRAFHANPLEVRCAVDILMRARENRDNPYALTRPREERAHGSP